MLMDFELYAPATAVEACRLKRELHAPILAGGTDLLVAMHGGREYEVLIDIKGIKELDGITETDEALTFGALTRHRTIEDSPRFRRELTAIWEGCSQVGSVQIRHRGTLGGNICNAVPSADSIGPLLVFDASCVVISERGERTVPLCGFFTGPRRTVLGEGEILKAIVLPKPAPQTGSCYIKYTRRRAMDLALCGYSILLTLADGVIACARVALTTSAPTPVRAVSTEEYLTGRRPEDVDLGELSRRSAADASPRSSWRSSAEFRLKLIAELAKQAYEKALARAEGGPL